MRRREFIGLAGAVVWPLKVRAEQAERVRSVGVLMSTRADDPEGEGRLSAFVNGLSLLGWIEGRNVRIDVRWGGGNSSDIRKFAHEIIAIAPDVILASGGSVVGPLLQETRTVPIVFTQTPDPVAAGFAASLSRPGGNATGFTQIEYGTAAKWLELLKEIAPDIVRAAVLRDPGIPEGIGQLAVIQAAASSRNVDVKPIDIRSAGEIERGITELARSRAAGVIVTSSGLANVHRELIITLAAQYRLPGVYSNRVFATDGGLVSYGAGSIEQHRLAARYIDRILNGADPAELPVQPPNKYDLVINLRTARAIGITIPPSLLARADEVIE